MVYEYTGHDRVPNWLMAEVLMNKKSKRYLVRSLEPHEALQEHGRRIGTLSLGAIFRCSRYVLEKTDRVVWSTEYAWDPYG